MKKILKISMVSLLIVGIFSIVSVEKISNNNDGIQITFKDGTGYWIEK